MKSYNQEIKEQVILGYSENEFNNIKNQTITNSFRNIYDMQNIIYRLIKTIDSIKEN